MSVKIKKTGKKPNLAVEVAGIKMRNPVMPASGTFGYGEEYEPFLDLERIGAIVTKGLSLKPKAGNPTPRIAETSPLIRNITPTTHIVKITTLPPIACGNSEDETLTKIKEGTKR